MAISIGDAAVFIRGDTSDLESSLDDSRSSTLSWAENLGSGISTILSGAATGGVLLIAGAIMAVGASIAAVAKESFDLSAAVDQGAKDAENSLGLVESKAKALTEVSKDIYAKGFGESFEEVNDIVIETTRQMASFGNVSEEELNAVATNSMAIAKTFDAEISGPGGVLDASTTLMEKFGISGQEATDLITAGMQNVPADDLLESISEYGPEFDEMGLSADQFMSILVSGAERGVLGTDKIADAFKEMGIILNEGTDESKEALSLLGMDYDEMAEQVASGNAKWGDFIPEILGGLSQVNDELAVGKLEVALFGTAAEDLPKGFSRGLDPALVKLDEVSGKAGELSGGYKSFSELFTEGWRQILVALEPVSSALLDIGNRALPVLIDGIRNVAPYIAEFSQIAAVYIGQFSDMFFDLAGQAMSWGYNIGSELAGGLMSAISLVIDVISEIGNTLSYWLSPGSPPRVAKDLDKWGKGAMQSYFDGFGDADFKAFNKISNEIEGALKNAVDFGDMTELESLDAMLASRDVLGGLIEELNETGDVSESSFAKLRDAAGAAGEEVEGIVRAHVKLQKASKETSKQEQELAKSEEAIANAQIAFNRAATIEEEQAALKMLETAEAKKEQIKSALEVAKANEDAAAVELKRQEEFKKQEDERKKLLKERADLEKELASGGEDGESGSTGDDAGKEAEARAKAERDHQFAIADTAGQISILEGELSNVEEGSVEYFQIQTQLFNLRQKQASSEQQASQSALKEQEKAASQAEKLRSKEQSEAEKEAERKQKELERAKEAEFQLQFAKSDTAGKIEMLREKQQGLSQDSAEFFELEKQIFMLEEQQASKVASAEGKSILGLGNDPIIQGDMAPLENVQNFMDGINEKMTFGEEGVGGLGDTFTGLQEKIDGVKTWFNEEFKPKWDEVWTFVGDKVTWFDEEIKPIIVSFLETIKEKTNTVLTFISDWWDEHGESIMIIVNTFMTGVRSVITTTLGIVKAVITTTLTLISDLWNRYGGSILEITSLIWDNIKIAITTVLDVISFAIDAFASLLTGDWQAFSDSLKNIWDTVWGGIEDILTNTTEIIETLIDDVVTTVTDIWDTFTTTLSDLWDDLWSGITEGWDGLSESFTESWDSIMETVDDWIQDFTDLGSDIVDGLWSGIEDSWDGLVDKFNDLWNTLFGETEKTLEVESPSKVYSRLGKTMPDGLSVGYEKSWEQFKKQSKQGLVSFSDMVADYMSPSSIMSDIDMDDQFSEKEKEIIGNLQRMIELNIKPIIEVKNNNSSNFTQNNFGQTNTDADLRRIRNGGAGLF